MFYAKNLFLSLIIICLSVVLQCFGFYNPGLWILLLGYLILIYVIIKNIGINSIFFFFILFFGLYTFSVPISIEFGFDIGKYREQYLVSWPSVDFSLKHYFLSSSLALMGITFAASVGIGSITKFQKNYINPASFVKVEYFRLSIISGFIASLFEFINFIRVGGFDALRKGKAFYQSAVSDIPITLPSEGFFFISLALFAYILGNKGFKNKEYIAVLIFSLINSFYIFISFYIGERGTLLVAIIIFFLGYTFYKKITAVRIRYLISFLLVFFFFAVITIYRNILDDKKGATISTSIEYLKKHSNRLMFVMNPANIEFGAPALVYRVYIENNRDYNLKYGLTYFYFIPNFIPKYINPYRAPTLVNDVRDSYFKDRKKNGSNASVGYSAILEALLNFGFFGAFLWGIIATSVILFVEYIRYFPPNKYNIMIYLLFFNIVLIITRSSSEFIIQQLILYSLHIIIIISISVLLEVMIHSKLRLSKT